MNDDLEAIQQVIDGEVEAFRRLVQRYQGPVLRIVRNIVNDDGVCEDIAQDVFLAAYRDLSSFDFRRGAFSTWLFTIARYKSVNALKKKRPRAMGEPPEMAAKDGPGRDLEDEEFFELLDGALNELPMDQKTAFVLAEFEELSYEEIARIENVRLGTVKSRISRARKRLQSLLAVYRGGKQ